MLVEERTAHNAYKKSTQIRHENPALFSIVLLFSNQEAKGKHHCPHERFLSSMLHYFLDNILPFCLIDNS